MALGSSLADGFDSVTDLVDTALARLSTPPVRVARASGWWRSAAWPAGSGPDYVNGIASVETRLTPADLLDVLLGLEVRFGRERRIANAPRTLDLDLIAYGRLVLDTPGLVLPHPRAAERLFVMGPLASIAPAWVHPVLGQTACALARRASVGLDAAPI